MLCAFSALRVFQKNQYFAVVGQVYCFQRVAVMKAKYAIEEEGEKKYGVLIVFI
jgi:hypothetical protein